MIFKIALHHCDFVKISKQSKISIIHTNLSICAKLKSARLLFNRNSYFSRKRDIFQVKLSFGLC